MKKKVLSLFVCICLVVSVFSGLLNISALESEDIVILYTNDVHSYVNNTVKVKDGETETEKPGLSYDSIAALKEDIAENETPNVLLVDAGDHIQGTAYGSIDKGQSVIELMNLAGYDLATVGNHEFDYGVEGLFNASEKAEFDYVSCNFTNLKTNKPVFEPYKIFDMGGKKVAIVGITTPDAYTATSPKCFEDENGVRQYGFLDSTDGQQLYDAIQGYINSAKEEGADYVIALAHLGVDDPDGLYSSYSIIKNTSGFNALIDAHSHTVIKHENVKDKSGKDVVLTQTGNYLANVGKLTISNDGTVTTSLIGEYEGFNASVREKKNELVASVNELLGKKIADLKVDLKINDENGDRIVRIMESNMGDFVADSYYYYINEVEGLNCDVAITNGGGVRSDILAGNISYMDMKNVSPFGNVVCVVKITGQKLLDLLECCARLTDGASLSTELGAFMQVAGVSFVIDTSVTSTVLTDNNGLWTGAPTGEYRVKDLKVFNKAENRYDDINLDAVYSLAGINYTLRNGGDGLGLLFDGVELVKDYILEDYLVTSEYAKAFDDVTDDGVPDINTSNSPLKKYSEYLLNYDTIYGSGRIVIENNSGTDETTDSTYETTAVTEAVSNDTVSEPAKPFPYVVVIIGLTGTVVVAGIALTVFKRKQ